MIYAEYLSVNVGGLYVHYVSNKLRGDGVAMADEPLELNDTNRSFLLNRMLSHAADCDQVFKLYDDVDICYNMVYEFVKKLFAKEWDMKNASQHIARHLYDNATPFRYKDSYIYIAYLKDAILNGETCDALAIFKEAPNVRTFKFDHTKSSFEMYQTVDGFECGAIIFNTQYEDGYRLVAFDNSKAKGMWMDSFLSVKEVQNEKTYTEGITNIYCGYIQNGIGEKFEASPVEKSLLMNKFRTVLENSDNYNTEEFDNAIFKQPEVIEHFNEYRKQHSEASGCELPENFTLDSTAVKKASRKIARKLKLDSNFHIYIHTYDEKLIEQGVDDGNGMNYVKLFYKNERSME